jgi:outer membrane protein
MFHRFVAVCACAAALPLFVQAQAAGASPGTPNDAAPPATPSSAPPSGSPPSPSTSTPNLVTDPQGLEGWRGRIKRPYVAKNVTDLDFSNSTHVHDLIRAGNLYLSLADAIALAVHNNLDIELQRYLLPTGATELLRAQGGGQLRGLLYTFNEAPTGIGGPNSPLVTTPATQSTPGTSVATNASALALLGEPQVNDSILGTVPLSPGSQIPVYDPFVSAQYNFQHTNTPQLTSAFAQNGDLETNSQNANLGYNQGFSPGTNISANFLNARQSTNSVSNSFNPYINSGLGVTVTQPLLRGFGRELNRRFIRIAGNEQKIASLLFRQQLIATVYGVVRLYTDLVSLAEDVTVKQDTYQFAQALLQDTQDRVNEGTQAPIELTRARAQVSATQQDLINSQGLLEEQEIILKNVITRQGSEDAELRNARIIATDPLNNPVTDETRPIGDLLNEASQLRPDLAQANLQTENTRISLEGSRNALRPELDLVGTAQSNALAGDPNSLNNAIPAGAFIGGYGGALQQVFTGKNPTVAVGLQLTLPVRNRVAQADAVRDELQLRQTQIRERQLRNQAQLEVEDALIGMRRSRAAYDAAVQTTKLQVESLNAEQLKFMEGASTSFFVIQYQSYVAQARSTELAAKGAYIKARASLQRAVGSILDDNGVSFDQAQTRH